MNSMKTIILVGSPKKNGQSMQLVNRFKRGINGEIEVINVFDYQPINPCLDCGHCKKNTSCKQNDGFEKIIEKLDMADCIVLASPMWFGNISGPMMSFMSRINVLANGYSVRKDREHKWNKIGILLMTTGAKWLGMSKSVEATVEFLFQEMDALMLDCIYANKTDKLPTNINKQAMLKCDRAAMLVNNWYNDKEKGNYIQYGYSSSNYIDYDLNHMENE